MTKLLHFLLPQDVSVKAFQNFTGFCGIGKGFSRHLPPGLSILTPSGPCCTQPHALPTGLCSLTVWKHLFSAALIFPNHKNHCFLRSLAFPSDLIKQIAASLETFLSTRTGTLFIGLRTTGKRAH